MTGINIEHQTVQSVKILFHSFLPSTRDSFNNLDYDLTKGLIYFGASTSAKQSLFPKLSKFNPKIRLMLVLSDFNENILLELFSIAWEDFKILNIYIVDFRQLSTFYAFNPFNRTIVRFIANKSFDAKLIKSFEKARISNLHGTRLRSSFFTFFMLADGQADQQGNFNFETLRFPDGETVRILAKTSNFSVDIIKTADGITYGWKNPNGSFTG
jgi:hypothetical protein